MSKRKDQPALCKNCNSHRRPVQTRGYCRLCYPIVLRLERTRKWNPSEPKTLLHYPRSPIAIALGSGEVRKNHYPSRHWKVEFPKIKRHTVKELQKRLLHFHLVEERLAGPISGFDLEIMFARLARAARARNRNLFSHKAAMLETAFTKRQRKLLFELLSNTLENITWKGIRTWGWMDT